MSKQPPTAPTASAVGPCPTVVQTVGRPGTGSLLSSIAPPDNPLPCCNPNCRTPRYWKFTQHHRTTRPPLPIASTIGPCPTTIQIIGRLDTESLHSTLAPPDHPRLVGCFGLNGPLRQYFSLYRTVSQREWGGQVVRWCWVNFQCRGVLQFGLQ